MDQFQQGTQAQVDCFAEERLQLQRSCCMLALLAIATSFITTKESIQSPQGTLRQDKHAVLEAPSICQAFLTQSVNDEGAECVPHQVYNCAAAVQ